MGTEVTNPRPIFITGEQRTGTSWVARVLSESPGVAWLDEPFNRKQGFPRMCDAAFPFWYTHIYPGNGDVFAGPVAATLGFEFPFWSNLVCARSRHQVRS